ncbi:unnamed protein product [Allacma fusca]|uniref:Uncharacterized protein n=1 Tax=Allacma fusca TaxID=39272 RepID=A0A8J2J694_9HEXA|nr:unnamed protein product [Allacma fusca]
MDPDCYERIFETKSVCIAFNELIEVFAMHFMVDVKKRRMYKTSTEKMLTSFSTMGISYHYPELYYPLESILGYLENAGLPSLYARNRMLIQESNGQRNAIHMNGQP